MNNAPARSDLIRARAQRMVAAGEAPDFHTACSKLAKHGAAARKARRRRRSTVQRAQTMWWNR